MAAYLRDHVLNEKKPFNKEYRIVRVNDGAVRWMHGLGKLEFGDTEQPVKMFGTIQDITERKHAEEEKEKLQAQFLQAQKMESVGRLAGGVAHDFNNMLQAILGNVDLAIGQVAPGKGLRENLEEIQKAAQRSAELTRQLLAFARKQTVSPKILDLNDVVSGMLKMLRRLIGEDIQLAWLPGPALWPVKIDPSQIDQILANLTVNARDAIDGIGKITLETANVTLEKARASLTDESPSR
jgi:C4-dicarboxylate-specific signal transduction histidine kinase